MVLDLVYNFAKNQSHEKYNIYQELLDGSLKHFLLAHEKTYGEGHKYVRQMNEIMNQLTYELTQKKWEGLFDGTT